MLLRGDLRAGDDASGDKLDMIGPPGKRTGGKTSAALRR
jgi:hypothetical protein